MLISHFAYLLVASFLIGASHGAFVRVAHAGQQSQQQNQTSQNSTNQTDLSQLYPVDIYLNDTLVWKSVLYGSVTHYLFVPQGVWLLKVNSSSSNTSGGGMAEINQSISISENSNFTLAIYATSSQQSSNTSGGQNETLPSSQSTWNASLFLEQLNSTSSFAYVKLYNFVPNAQISLVLMKSNMSTGGSNMSTPETPSSENVTEGGSSMPPSENQNMSTGGTNMSTPGYQVLIQDVTFANASEYTELNQTVALQQLALLVNGQLVPLDDFKMNSTYLNTSFVQNFDFRFLRMGDKYSIFAIPSIPTARQFYVFGNDTMSSLLGSTGSINQSESTSSNSSSSGSSGSTDILTQITRDDLPRADAFIRFVSGIPEAQLTPSLDNKTLNSVSIGNVSNFYRVYAGLHIVSLASPSQPQSPNTSVNATETSDVTSATNEASSNLTGTPSNSQLVLLHPNTLFDFVAAGSASNVTNALVPSNISFPLDLGESALKLVNLVSSDQNLTLMITSQNTSSSNVSTSEVVFMKGSNYVVLNASSYTLQLMQNNQTVATLENVQLTATSYFTVFAVPQAQQNATSQNETSGNSTGAQNASSIQLVLAFDAQTIALPIGSYARFIVSIGSANTSAGAGNQTSENATSSGQTNSTQAQGKMTVMVDDTLFMDVDNGVVTEYISMPSGMRNITLMNENGDIMANSVVDITPNSTHSILIYGSQQSIQIAVAQDTRRSAMSPDSVRLSLINLDINSESISLVQNQSTLISNITVGNWSQYQDVMISPLELSSLTISGPSGQSPIQPLHRSGDQSQNQSQALNPYFAYSIIAFSQSGGESQNATNSSMGAIVSDSTFRISDVAYVRFIHASPDTPAVDIFMNDLLVYSNMMPQNSTFYIPVIKGLFNISIVAAQSSNQSIGEPSLNQTMSNETSSTNQSTSAPLLNVLFAFQYSAFYTFAIIEPRQNLTFDVIEDKVIPTKQMANDSAQVRLVNLAFDTQGLSVTATMNGRNISIANDIDYLDSSEYTIVEPGEYQFVVSQGTSGTPLKTLNITVVSRNFYTIWITNANQSVSANASQGAFIERQVSEDNGAFWLDDIEDWAGSVNDFENDLFEEASSNATSGMNETSSESSNMTANSNQTSALPINRSEDYIFGTGRYDDLVFFGEFILNKSRMNISETEETQNKVVMGQWDRMYRAFYGAKEDPFGLGLALPRKV